MDLLKKSGKHEKHFFFPKANPFSKDQTLQNANSNTHKKKKREAPTGAQAGGADCRGASRGRASACPHHAVVVGGRNNFDEPLMQHALSTAMLLILYLFFCSCCSSSTDFYGFKSFFCFCRSSVSKKLTNQRLSELSPPAWAAKAPVVWP